MRDLIIIIGMCAAAILIGAWLYLYGPSDFMKEDPYAAVAGQQAGATAALADEPQAEVPFTVIGHGKQSEITVRKNFAVYSEDEFAKLWKQTGSTEKVPVIDFSKAYVVAVFAGEKPTAGYTIAVEQVTELRDKRTIHVTIEEPGDGCEASNATMNPYQIIRVPFSEAEPVRLDTQKIVPCSN